MNNANFKSNVSSKHGFRLEYCWLPVPGRRENFTGLLICIRKGSFNKTRGGGGGMKILSGVPKIFRHPKGGALKQLGGGGAKTCILQTQKEGGGLLKN